MKTRYEMLACNGYNPRTGKKVGTRHRWRNSMCIWCGRFKEDVLVKVEPRERR